MGCAFDMHSTSWTDRSYVFALFVLCWCIPLLVIFTAYIGIIYRVRHSFVANANLDNSSRRGLLKIYEGSSNIHRDSENSRSPVPASQRVNFILKASYRLKILDYIMIQIVYYFQAISFV